MVRSTSSPGANPQAPLPQQAFVGFGFTVLMSRDPAEKQENVTAEIETCDTVCELSRCQSAGTASTADVFGSGFQVPEPAEKQTLAANSPRASPLAPLPRWMFSVSLSTSASRH